MPLRDALTSAISRLTAERVPSPRMNAEVLLMFVLGCDRAYLYAHPERELTVEESARYDEALAQRASGVPAQYITGHQEFWGMDFIVSPAVLIPRPETEHVIETVLELARACSANGFAQDSTALPQRLKPQIVQAEGGTAESRALSKPAPETVAERLKNAAHGASRGLNAGDESASQGRKNKTISASSNFRIVDVGTGSGCIALALTKELPQAEVHAVDISAAALEVARANAARHQLEDRIQFHESDLLHGLEPDSFDFVVSNPPYVGELEEDQVQLEVRKFEPRTAVFAGPRGLEIIERLIPQSDEVLKPGGWLVMEISGTIAEGVKQLLSSWQDVRVINDLQGIPRVAMAQKSNLAE